MIVSKRMFCKDLAISGRDILINKKLVIKQKIKL